MEGRRIWVRGGGECEDGRGEKGRLFEDSIDIEKDEGEEKERYIKED